MWILLISLVLLKHNVFPMRSTILLFGNVPGARAADDPSHSEETDRNKGSAEAQLKLPKDAVPD